MCGSFFTTYNLNNTIIKGVPSVSFDSKFDSAACNVLPNTSTTIWGDTELYVTVPMQFLLFWGGFFFGVTTCDILTGRYENNTQ